MSSPIIAGILMDFPFGYFAFAFGISGSLLIGLLIIVYLEAAIFYRFRGGSWRQAVSDSFWINIASSVLGYMTTFAIKTLDYRSEASYYNSRPSGYDSEVDWTHWFLFDENLIPGVPSAVIFLLLSFLVSILCEGLLYERLAKPYPKDDSWTLVTIANVASYALLFSVYLWWQFLPGFYAVIFGLIEQWPLTLLFLIILTNGFNGTVWRVLRYPWLASILVGLFWGALLLANRWSLAGFSRTHSWIAVSPFRLSQLVMSLKTPNSYSSQPPAKLVLFFSTLLALSPWSCWRIFRRHFPPQDAAAAVNRQADSPDLAVPLKEPPATDPLP